MEFRDALKTLRPEPGVTQTELAGILQASISTVNRREPGRTCPSRSVAKHMPAYAAGHASQRRLVGDAAFLQYVSDIEYVEKPKCR